MFGMGTGVALKVIGTRFGVFRKKLVPSRLHIEICLRKDLLINFV